MGFEDRDYARGSAARGFFDQDGYHGGFPPVLKWILILNIAVFVLQLLITRPARLSDLERYQQFAPLAEQFENLSPEERRQLESYLRYLPRVSYVENWLEFDARRATRGGQIWRFVTYAFCHDRSGSFPWHLVINMWVLWLFGPAIERMYGSREFLWFYLTAALAAGLAFAALALAFRLGPMIGASGAVIAVFALYAWHFPRNTILVFFVIPVEVRWLLIVYAIWDLTPVLKEIGGDEVRDGVAHAAHLGGLAFGLLYAKYGLRLDDYFGRLRLGRFRWKPRSRAQRQIRIYEPPRREDLEQQVDAILQKIHEHGEASLTDEERNLLREASRRYKSR